MRSILRCGAAAVLAGGGLVAPAVSASADPTGTDDPCARTGSYLPAPGCVLAVSDVQAGCTDDIDPYLTYALTPPVPTEQVRITVTDGSRSGEVTGGPSGSVAWPAAVTGKSATVTFTTQTSPAYTASVTVSTPPCASQVLVDDPSTPTAGPSAPDAAVLADGPAKTTSQALATTGSQVGPVAAVATGLLLFGGLVFLASRRRSA
ncbi:MAG: hypothetical protein FWH11_15225 [Micrococcales bacterium]|nr:hypothetical protein [Micrococcales bacterium]